jgi:AcrR family transcriptional regulator
VPGDSEATKARILVAATEEFARYGLAGARVDRLAARAPANKQLIYAYFGSKEQLFDRTLESKIEELLDAVPFTAGDLAGYAAALFDYDRAHPELVRLVLWHSLERPGVLQHLHQSAESTSRKISQVAQAQASGAVDATLSAAQLLGIVLAMVHGDVVGIGVGVGSGEAGQAGQAGETGHPGEAGQAGQAGHPVPAEERREALRQAVRRLTEP